MTTPIATPWDARIAELEPHSSSGDRYELAILRWRAEGYCKAKMEDADLVEALRRIAAGELGPDEGVGADLNQAYHAEGIAQAALAKHQREVKA